MNEIYLELAGRIAERKATLYAIRRQEDALLSAIAESIKRQNLLKDELEHLEMTLRRLRRIQPTKNWLQKVLR